jgi:hypothetical protein
MSRDQSLSEAVKNIEQKAAEHGQAQKTQQHVGVARRNIIRINNEIDGLEATLEDLQHYKTVLENAFDGSTPRSMDSAVEDAKDAVEFTQAELLDSVQKGNLTGGNDKEGSGEEQLTPEIKEQISEVQSSKEQLKEVVESIRDELKNRRNIWMERIDSADELQEILDEQNSDFSQTINHLRELLTEDLLDTGGDASEFVFRWERATDNWESYRSLQSFDDFQRKHSLSDSTVEDIKKLSGSQQLTLADVSLESLEEMKRVDELESATELSL